MAKEESVEELKMMLRMQEMVIDQLRSQLFQGWNLTNNYHRILEEDDD